MASETGSDGGSMVFDVDSEEVSRSGAGSRRTSATASRRTSTTGTASFGTTTITPL